MLEQCARIASELGYAHLSTGDLLREEQKNDSALAKEIDECIRYNYCAVHYCVTVMFPFDDE